MRVLVGIHGGGFNGIDVYAEQVAIAAATAGLEVCLLVASSRTADEVRPRIAGMSITLVDAGLEEPSARRVLAERLWPALATRRLSRVMARSLERDGSRFAVIHVNRASLAAAARPFGDRICVAGWFYPHSARRRILETWRHTRGNLARRLVLASKSLSFYLGDEAGYRASDCVVACTETLAGQLRGQGLEAVACPPPVRALLEERAPAARDRLRLSLLVCSGDLSHPRKNLRDAVEALRYLVTPGREVVLHAIGRMGEGLLEAARQLPAGARLELVGPLSPHEVHARMREADVLLLPSLFEEWGYVAVESLMSGTPVVAYPVYPFAEMLTDGLGVVATEVHPKSLAAAVERVLEGACRPDLRAAAEARFGSVAVGARLADIWARDRNDARHPVR
jgi:glycosyltransferase involved in cell wall biosynthesis